MKQNLINNIMTNADNYFVDLFGEGEAWTFSANLNDALHKLTVKQLEAIDAYIKERGFDVSIGHDVFGIVKKERHFLPRIKALQAVTPYLT